jgi:glyoxylase-like metal-dependent hydrolase (beta-lactamase superfamily II)
MSVEQVVPGVFQVSLGMVNVFFLVGEDVTLIDTGIPGSAPKILNGLREIGRQPNELRRILLTHLHADHTGSVKALVDVLTAAGGGVEVTMHAADAQAFQQGVTKRPSQPAPGLLNTLLANVITKLGGEQKAEPVQVDHLLSGGERLPVAGGLDVIAVPGHTAGSVAFLWPQQGGVLFAGDTCGQMSGRLGYPPIFEDFELAKQGLHSLSKLTFETAVFGHGKPIRAGASQAFRAKWG